MKDIGQEGDTGGAGPLTKGRSGAKIQYFEGPSGHGEFIDCVDHNGRDGFVLNLREERGTNPAPRKLLSDETRPKEGETRDDVCKALFDAPRRPPPKETTAERDKTWLKAGCSDASSVASDRSTLPARLSTLNGKATYFPSPALPAYADTFSTCPIAALKPFRFSCQTAIRR